MQKVVVVCALGALLFTGCANKTGTGALTGGILGAGAGAGIGAAVSGGTEAAIGAGAGAVGGALIGGLIGSALDEPILLGMAKPTPMYPPDFETMAVLMPIASLSRLRRGPTDLMTSRFVLKSDERVNELTNMSLPVTRWWWSRPYEYAWAMEFAGKDLVVLDAACGLPHPLKWHLGSTCNEVWACDIDPTITDSVKLLQVVRQELGEATYQTLKEKGENPRLHFVHASICDLPNTMPQFDRIFCISTFEHMSRNDQKKALAEFARKLKPDGLLIMTIDYPVVTSESLLSMAKDAGLIPAGDCVMGLPPRGALAGEGFHIYRCVLKNSPKTK